MAPAASVAGVIAMGAVVIEMANDFPLVFQLISIGLTLGGMFIITNNNRSKVMKSLEASISSHARELHQKFDEHQVSDTAEFKTVRAEFNNEIRMMTSRTGEMGHSLTARINDLKDWTRDNCVMEKSAASSHATVMGTLTAMDQKADARSGIIEARLIAVERIQTASDAARTLLEARVAAVELLKGTKR